MFPAPTFFYPICTWPFEIFGVYACVRTPTGLVVWPGQIRWTPLHCTDVSPGLSEQGGNRLFPRFWWLNNPISTMGRGRLYPPYYYLPPRFSDLPTSLLSPVALRCLYLERIATTHTKWSSRRATKAHWIIWLSSILFLRGMEAMEHKFHWKLCYISLQLF